MLDAFILGIIEGLTEFLPISSTGHLLIVEHWLGRRSDLFNIAIQAGAIAAVTLVYRRRLLELVRGRGGDEPRDYLLKLLAAFLVTALLGFAAKIAGASLPDTLTPVAAALIGGGVIMLLAERYARRTTVSERVTWTVALAVGIAQVVAGVLPGTSRSAAAIVAALFAGLTSRPRAAEFAFLVGIPTMFAATGYEALSALRGQTTVPPSEWAEIAVAFLTATATGFVAVRWILRFVATHTFAAFAWYRIALGGALLVLLR
jgi:undecaprenyl-diphosphatase